MRTASSRQAATASAAIVQRAGERNRLEIVSNRLCPMKEALMCPMDRLIGRSSGEAQGRDESRANDPSLAKQ